MRAPELFDVPVRGGTLRVARWAGRDGAPVVMGAHGVTANHRNFSVVADLLGDEVTLVAPDLRGRGGSNALPGPFGMRAHAEDIIAVMDHLAIDRAVLLGHSMGGFVIPAAAVLYPDRVASLVVVDGGIKIFDPPPGVELEDLVKQVIGPSLERLKMTFASRETYFDFWRPHPGLKELWGSGHLEAYFDYDLVRDGDGFRSGVLLEAVLRDSTDTLLDDEVVDAIRRVTQPITFLYAERGLFDETPGLYTEEKVALLAGEVPQLQSEMVVANHWTILFGSGAPLVAEHVRKAAAS